MAEACVADRTWVFGGRDARFGALDGGGGIEIRDTGVAGVVGALPPSQQAALAAASSSSSTEGSMLFRGARPPVTEDPPADFLRATSRQF